MGLIEIHARWRLALVSSVWSSDNNSKTLGSSLQREWPSHLDSSSSFDLSEACIRIQFCAYPCGRLREANHTPVFASSLEYRRNSPLRFDPSL